MEAKQLDSQPKRPVATAAQKKIPIKIVLLGESGVGKSSIAHR